MIIQLFAYQPVNAIEQNFSELPLTLNVFSDLGKNSYNVTTLRRSTPLLFGTGEKPVLGVMGRPASKFS
jgi:hypothetical protein